MSVGGYLRYLHLAYCSKPAADRLLYRQLRRLRPRSIVELGLESGERTTRMLRLARELAEGAAVRYTACDQFEARPASQPGLTLKEAHRTFGLEGVQLRLVPGDVYSVLMRTANSLTGTDLLLISGPHEPHLLEAAWFFVPRMLGAQSLVLQQVEGREGPAWSRVTPLEVEQRASHSSHASRAA